MEKNTMQCKKKTTLGWVLVRLHGTWGDSLSGWGSCGKCFGILNIFSSCLCNANYFCNVCRNLHLLKYYLENNFLFERYTAQGSAREKSF